MINFNKEANEIKDELIAIRRDLHMSYKRILKGK